MIFVILSIKKIGRTCTHDKGNAHFSLYKNILTVLFIKTHKALIEFKVQQDDASNHFEENVSESRSDFERKEIT